MKVLVSASAGFIGATVSERLIARGDQVIGVDNLDPYYDSSYVNTNLVGFTNILEGWRHNAVEHLV